MFSIAYFHRAEVGFLRVVQARFYFIIQISVDYLLTFLLLAVQEAALMIHRVTELGVWPSHDTGSIEILTKSVIFKRTVGTRYLRSESGMTYFNPSGLRSK